ncbi:MAG: hypothetical protein ABI704_08385, partial [Kofleriaceae bacterium]
SAAEVAASRYCRVTTTAPTCVLVEREVKNFGSTTVSLATCSVAHRSSSAAVLVPFRQPTNKERIVNLSKLQSVLVDGGLIPSRPGG